MPKPFLTIRLFMSENGQDNFRSYNLFHVGKHFFWQEVHLLKSFHINETVPVVLGKHSHLGQIN